MFFLNFNKNIKNVFVYMNITYDKIQDVSLEFFQFKKWWLYFVFILSEFLWNNAALITQL